MRKVEGCKECVALWGRYVEAVTQDIQISGKLRLALLSNDLDSVSKLEAVAHAAEQTRRAARHDIVTHGSTKHPKDPA